MTLLKSHCLHDDDRRYIASVHPASPEAVEKVLKARDTDPDGRSQWVWVWLTTGELVLGVFPQGDTFCEIQRDAEYK